jgi:beta-barrel assembly-enhancing protease
MRPHQRPRFAALLAIAPLMAGCVGSYVGPMLISDPQEVEIGRGIVQDLQQSQDFHLLGDQATDAYINDLGQRILAASPVRRSFPFSFQTVAKDEVNAFALPGGFCYVQTGLIEEAQNEAELVGVLAHEMSHVALGHHRAELANQALMQTAQGLVLGQDSPFAAQAAARVASGLGVLQYSRTQEAEADRLAADAMARAGWDPRALREFFARLEQETHTGDASRLSQLLSTHPSNVERVQALDAQIAQMVQMGLPPNLATDSPAFEQIKQRVAQLTGGSASSQAK